MPEGQNPDGFEVELRDLPARTVAYVRVFDPYQPTAVHENWTGRPFAHGLEHLELSCQLPVKKA